MTPCLDRAISLLLAGLLLAGPLIISPWGYDHGILIKESFVLFISGGLVVLAFLRAAATGAFPFRATPLGKPVLVLAGLAVLSVLRAVNLPAALYRLALLLAGVSLYYVAAHAGPGRERAEHLAKMAVAAASVASLYAFLQYFRLDPFGLVPLSSSLSNPNSLAEYLAAVLPVTLALALCPGSARQKHLYRLAAVFLFAALLLTRGRAAALALVASLVFLGLLVRRRPPGDLRGEVRRLYPWAGLAVCLAGLFGFRFLSGFGGPGGIEGLLTRYAGSGGIQQNVMYRVVSYRDSLRMILDNPALGVGVGNFEFAYPRYRTMPESLDPEQLVLDHAFNDYLELGAELGVGGAIALVWLLAAFFRRMFRSHEPSVLASGFAASVAALAVNSLFASGLYTPMSFATFWLSLALAIRLEDRAPAGQGRGAGSPSERRPPLWALLVGLAALAALTYASVRPLVADAYLSRGQKLFVRGWVGEAIPHLERAAHLAPTRLEAQGYLAQAYVAAGRHSDAVAVLERYLPYDPHAFRVHYFLGRYLEAAGDREAALRAYGKARDANPLFSKPLLRIGIILEGRGDHDGAIGAYRGAVRLNPAFAEAANNLALLLARRGRLDEAIRIWEDGAKASPRDLILAENLAAAYAKSGDRRKALLWSARADEIRRRERR